MERLLVILGPTASGKTKLSLACASALNGEIISGDSMQVYRGMNIGTAKLPISERTFQGTNIVHHLLDIKNPDENFTVAEFSTLAAKLITDINNRGKLPILTGGTGFYLESVYTNNLFKILPARDTVFCNDLKKESNNGAILHEQLRLIDTVAAERIHANDIIRLTRALDIYKNYGLTPTQIAAQTALLPPKEYQLFKCGIDFAREELYHRINERVDAMLAAGLVEEVRCLLEQGYSLNNKSMCAIGYKQIIEYLQGQYSYEDAVQFIKRDTRHFAKRQFTWFKRDKEIKWYSAQKFNNFEDLCKNATDEIGNYFAL